MRWLATDHVTIVAEPDRHFAFPGVARLQDGSLAVVFRQGKKHVDPSGSIGMCRSTDGGRTWSPRRTIYDHPDRDERDPGIFLHSGGTMLDLNDLIDPASGWLLSSASDINEAGWIVGTGYIDGEEHGFLLIPIPEPSVLALALFALAALAARAARRR